MLQVQTELITQAIFDEANDAFILFHPETYRILEVNPAAQRLTQLRRKQLQEMRLSDLLESSHDVGLHKLCRAFQVTTLFYSKEEYFLRQPSGPPVAVNVSASRIHSEPQPLGLLVIRDISDRKKAEAQIVQAHKMEAVGRLAAGLAHDFNTQLTVINGYSSLLLQKLDDKDPNRKKIQHIYDASRRAEMLIRQVLSFGNKQVVQPKMLNLNTVIRDTEEMLARLVGEKIRLVTQLSERLGSVHADPGQIDLVIMNLVLNAHDAMPGGGDLFIETASTELSQAEAQQKIGAQPGPYVQLTVRDTGCGMSQEILSHLFEPFFTTKGPTQGTGLGLTTVYAIVQQAGGHIEVESAVGKGTAFRIYLPRIPEKKEDAEQGEAITEIPRGSKTILIVEDEPMITDLARSILEEIGYKVLEAVNGEEALKVFKLKEGRIDLLLTDVRMPRMNGLQLAEQLRAARPDMKMIFMSGYSDEILLSKLNMAVGFLPKPFTTETLTQKVSEALGGLASKK